MGDPYLSTRRMWWAQHFASIVGLINANETACLRSIADSCFPMLRAPNVAKGKSNMIDLIPDSTQLAEIFAHAIAPTFFLGAIAAFISLMNVKLSAIMQRVQYLNSIAEDDPTRAHLKSDLDRLRCRARFLKSGILAALNSGLCATLLLGVLFTAAFFRFNHAYGAPLLFVFATIFLGFALLRFAQEARISLADADEHL